MSTHGFDHVVVEGTVVAARLSEDPCVTVCVWRPARATSAATTSCGWSAAWAC